MKIVILGAKGMLGADLGKTFYDLNPYLLDKDELNIANKKSVSLVFRHLKPDYIINAAAYTDVDGCEAERDLAMRVNGEAPGYLAEAAKEVGAVFVHYSTDYVFSGMPIGLTLDQLSNLDGLVKAGYKNLGYRETDEPQNPLNFYGESKLAGENAVKKVGGKYYLIRTSWLFGLGGKESKERPRNFIETILRLAEERDAIRVVNDQHGKPTFTLDVAKRTKELIEKNPSFGIYHVTNEPATNWYEFARAILAVYAEIRGGEDKSEIICPCTSLEFPRPARRPQYAILLNTKLPRMRSWQEALKEYLQAR